MKKIISVFALALICGTISAQMGKFQALYIFNFAKEIGWPKTDEQNEFVITVIGDNGVASELNKLAKTKKVGSRNVVIKEASSINGISKSDIIVLGESRASQIGQLVQLQHNNKSVIVSCKQGQCSSGACIAFEQSGSRLGFEISEQNFKKKNLSVHNKLLQLGKQVD